jgi:HTH-type transcriptional regulator/antitoxin HigA
MTMDIKPIKTKADYQAALKEIEILMDAKPRTPRGDRLEVLVTLVEAYEAKHYPLDLPDPVAAIKYAMESKGLTVKDLEPMIGRSNRVYEILSHKRPLTLKMIWALHRELGIPAESLVRPAKKARAA